MSYFIPFKVIGAFLLAFTSVFVVPLLVSIYFQDQLFWIYIFAGVASFLLGLAFYLPSLYSKTTLSHRGSFVVVTFCWIFAALLGAVPFYLSECFNSQLIYVQIANAIFESASGFTTTGASVISNIEGLPPSLLFFRCFIQWLGGMGIILLSLAILPLLGVGGMDLFRAEVPGPVTDKVMPRIQETARYLWVLYMIFSGIQVVCLKIAGMGWYDSFCHMFTTMATGGFSTKNASILSFNNPTIEWVIILFMFIAGCNFALHYQLVSGKNIKKIFTGYWGNAEFRFYLFVIMGSSILLSAGLLYADTYDSAFNAIRYACFQVVSITTTTGYASADYEQWPHGGQAILLLLMFVGGCAGSTGGGIKVMRIMLLLKLCKYELVKLIHPRAVLPIKIGKKSVPPHVIQAVYGFIGLYLLAIMVSSFMMAVTGLDILTAVTAVITTIGNVGPGFGMIGPMENFASISSMGKIILSSCMIMGRLEIYTFIILFMPIFWKK